MRDQVSLGLRPWAELRCATDDKSYLPYALERLMAPPALTGWPRAPLIGKRPAVGRQTRYETKAITARPRFALCDVGGGAFSLPG